METIESLTEYIDLINKLNFAFYFNFKDINKENEINSFIQNIDIDIKQNNRSAHEQAIAKIWEQILPRKEDLFEYALSKRYVEAASISKFYFRGVSNTKHLNAPGIYRANLPKEKTENYFFNEIQVRCPAAFSGMKNINKLTYMQHYGCPTRLLDISSNPLVALYFACLGSETTDGKVNIFGVLDDDILYEHSDRVQMLSKLAEFNASDQKQILILSYIHLLKEKFPQSSTGKYVDNVIERFYHAIKRDNGAFEREIIPLDLLKPIFVQVNKDNPRILKQDGAFIMSGLDLSEEESNYKINRFLTEQILIPSNVKQSLLKELKRVCINQASLFPEVDQVASYLKNT